MKIVFLDAATMGSDLSLDCIASLGEYTSWPLSTKEEALERVADCEVLIVNKIIVDKQLIDAAPSLRLICEAATGVNNIDLEYAASKGIAVKNVAAYSTDSVAQLSFAHILHLVNRLPYFDGRVKSGEYARGGMFTDLSLPFFELSGKKMGIIGMGAIGQKVALIAQSFGMEVSYFPTSGVAHCDKWPAKSIDELLSESDVVSIHAPLNDRTRGLIGKEGLSIMKPEAILVNMGRGGIVDEAALAQAIDEGIIAGAALDVYEKEPLTESNPLMKVIHKERLSLSPHVGWASLEARQRLAAAIARNISSFFQS